MADPSDLPRAEELIRGVCAEVYAEPAARRLTIAAEGLAEMIRIGGLLTEAGIAVDDLGLQRPSLDDVFLHLTGHRAETEDPPASDDPAADPELEGASR